MANFFDCGHYRTRGGEKRRWCRDCPAFQRKQPNGQWTAWMTKRRSGPSLPKSQPINVLAEGSAK
jgi:hypothetical protein